MPNIAKLLKEEIQRLARREIKAAITALRKDNAALKRSVAELKRRLSDAEVSPKRAMLKHQSNAVDVTEDEVKSARITAKMIRAIRSRLGLSQDAFAKMAGVSGQTVYQWEHANGRLNFRGNTKTRIISIRRMKKREVKRYLENM